MRYPYVAGAVILSIAITALFFVERLSFVCFIFALQATLILFAIELLFRGLPTPLLMASEDNCYRLDGSYSRRRRSQERGARLKFRSDLLAVFLVIALIGNWFTFYVHSKIVPIPIALNAARAFDVDPQLWKHNLRDNHIVEEYEGWMQSRVPIERDAVKSQAEGLWNSWPGLIFLGLAWAIGSAIFLGRAHVKIVREFEAGIAARTQSNLNRDIIRLQHP